MKNLWEDSKNNTHLPISLKISDFELFYREEWSKTLISPQN